VADLASFGPRDRGIVERELGHRTSRGGLKKPYRTKALAKRGRVADGMQGTGLLDMYRCGVCRMWHLGNRVPVAQ
jgi:hypothetical protein